MVNKDYTYDVDEGTQKYFDSLMGIKSLSKDEEKKLLRKYRKKNDLNARNKLIVSNLKYACTIANKYRGKGIPYDELISEANNGLIESLDRYDMKQDVKIICYSKWWMIQKIQEAIAKKNKTPYSDLPNDNDTQIMGDDDEISVRYTNKSNDEYIYDEYEDENDESVTMFINEMYKCVTERERKFIKAYYGIEQDALTLEEIGRQNHLTKERVRQIIDLGLRKIRANAVLSDRKFLSR